LGQRSSCGGEIASTHQACLRKQFACACRPYVAPMGASRQGDLSRRTDARPCHPSLMRRLGRTPNRLRAIQPLAKSCAPRWSRRLVEFTDVSPLRNWEYAGQQVCHDAKAGLLRAGLTPLRIPEYAESGSDVNPAGVAFFATQLIPTHANGRPATMAKGYDRAWPVCALSAVFLVLRPCSRTRTEPSPTITTDPHLHQLRILRL
jgi:hypothetical protein